MADRRPEDSSVAPRRTLAGPDTSTGPKPAPHGGAGQQSERSEQQHDQQHDRRLDDTVASPPVRDDDTDEPKRSSGAERFAAAISAAKEKSAGRITRDVTGGGAPRKVRKAHLRLAHVDPWSVMKTAFLLSVAIGIVLVVAVMVIWSVLGATGVWDSINRAVTDVIGNEGTETFDIENYLGMSRVMGFTLVVAVIDVVLITVITTLGAFLYNLAAVLLGGVEVTLAEDDRSAAGSSSSSG